MVYFIATPIGNMGEITYRAVSVLAACEVIFCEDTTHSAPLLRAYNIDKPLRSYHKFNERARLDEILKIASEGKDVAVISDAGTPGISDPGNALVNALIENNIKYTVVGCPCAAVSAAVLSGMCGGGFCFAGFLPPGKKECDRLLTDFGALGVPTLFYVPPHDLDNVIARIYAVYGARRFAAVREISKVYEEVVFGSLAEGYKGERRGEFVLVVAGAEGTPLNNLTLEEHIKHYLVGGLEGKEAVKRAASDRGIPKNEAYQAYLGFKG